MFMFVGFLSLANDLFFCVKENKSQKAAMTSIAYPLLLIASFMTGPFVYFFVSEVSHGLHGQRVFWAPVYEVLQTLPGALGVLLAGLILLALDVYVYQRRRSYLEESAYPGS